MNATPLTVLCAICALVGLIGVLYSVHKSDWIGGFLSAGILAYSIWATMAPVKVEL